MTGEAVAKAIHDQLLSNLAGLAGFDWDSDEQVAFENEGFDPPQADPWMRLAVRGFPSQQDSLGPKGYRKFKRDGRIFVQVFTKADTGRRDSDAISWAVNDIFEGETFGGGVHCLAGSVREIGTDGKWLQFNVEIPFWYEEEK